MPRTPAMIVDIDGTIALNNTGRPWYGPGFENRVIEDDINPPVAATIRALYNEDFIDHVLFVSGRMEISRPQTTQWLTRHGFSLRHPSRSLYMRKNGDKRPDVEAKTDIYNEHIRDTYDVRLALDDRPEMVALWRSMGIPTWAVNEYR